MKKTLTVITVLLTALAFPNVALAWFYPDDGSIYYDGFLRAESYLRWNSTPGPWQNVDPGYEHDFAVRPQYINACASFTNMPYGYDDCPTAGFFETGVLWIYSFGTYHARFLAPGVWYWGRWNFARPAGAWSSSEVGLYSNEVAHTYCSYDSPWCMGGVLWYPHLRSILYYGSPLSAVW